MFTQETKPKPSIGRVRDPEATRERILECAFTEMYEHGYAGASLDRILADSGVTKGALYHHFGSKAELAIAVIEEVIRPRFLELWIAPARDTDDPLRAFIDATRSNFGHVDDCFVRCGCPLNNLSQELSNEDELFRTHLNGVFETARGQLARALTRGQQAGTVRRDVDADGLATLVVAGLEGIATTVKTSRDLSLGISSGEVFLQVLEGLRTGPSESAA